MVIEGLRWSGQRSQPATTVPGRLKALPSLARVGVLVDLRPAIRRMIAMLLAAQREAIVLTEYMGMSQVELARHLGISVSGAKSRVQRARAQLRRLLDECCHFEFDGRGRVIEAVPRKASCAG